jgi:hypothetical protein
MLNLFLHAALNDFDSGALAPSRGTQGMRYDLSSAVTNNGGDQSRSRVPD